MDLVSNELDVSLTLGDGVVFPRLTGGVVDKRAVVHHDVRVLHQHQYPGAGVDGAVSCESASANGDAVVPADEGHRPFVAVKLASINGHINGTGHVSSTTHRGPYP